MFFCRECPTELKEAISTLLFAASRCGEFPELQEIRALVTSRYGKEFVNRAIELRNNCGVNATVWMPNLTIILCVMLNSRAHQLKDIDSWISVDDSKAVNPSAGAGEQNESAQGDCD